MIIVSACLAGLNCRYDGTSNTCKKVMELVAAGKALPLCPEQLGGLATPRDPSEIVGDNIVSNCGNDVTGAFVKGAQETLKIAKLVNCTQAILKQRSPSCGYGKIYDGTHSGAVIEGLGITAKLLADNGIAIITEEDFPEDEE